MDHPNIAKVLDAGQTSNGRPYFVMDLVKGLPVTEFCDQGQLTPRERLELFAQVCQAVQHAHQKGIIHRDIKPSNVLVTLQDGTPLVKVIDFGIAKALGQQLTDRTLFTGFAQMIGTPLYMSPEQAALSNVDVDTRSDVYSLGVLLYELLTGTTPFTKERLQEASYDELRRIIREEEPPKPSTRISTLGQAAVTVSTQRKSDPKRLSQLVRGELDWIVMKALEKDRNRRYESASAFAADVQRYLADEPVQACPPSAWYRLRKFARRNRGRLVAAGVLGLALLVAAGGIGWTALERAGRQRRAANDLELALDRAEFFHAQGNRAEARAALDRAELFASQARPDADRDERLVALKERVADEARYQDFIARFEKIRLEVQSRLNVAEGGFEVQAAFPEIQDALREYGITIGVMTPAEAVASIQGRSHLIAALDECLRQAPEDDESMGKWLATTLIAADRDDWRRGARRAMARHDLKALAILARDVDVRKQPPSFLLVLARDLPASLQTIRLDLARRIQHAYPADLWANIQLGIVLVESDLPAEAVRYFTVAVALRPDNPAMYTNRAGALRAAGEVDAAIADCRHALALAPHDSAAHNNLGFALDDKGLVDEAIAEYREAIRCNPRNHNAHTNLGFALALKGQLDEAIAAHREAIRVKNDFAEAHNHLGNALKRKGLLDEAIAAYREAIRIKPDFYYAHANLGGGLQAKGLIDEGIAEVRTAIRIKPDFAGGYLGLGIALKAKGQLDDAIAAYREAIRLKKDYADAHSNLGIALHDKGQSDEAIAAYREAIRIKTDYAAAYYNLGIALKDNGQLDEAIAAYQEAICLNADDAEAHTNLGIVLKDKGQLDEAIAEYRTAIGIKKDLPEAHDNLGNALRAKGQLDEAIGAHREAIRIKPDFAAAHDNLGNALNAKGLVVEAIAAYREAIRVNPRLPLVHCNLGVALAGQGRLDEAIAAYRESLRITPEDAETYYGLGRALAIKDQFDAAIPEYRAAIRLKKDHASAHHDLACALRNKGQLDEAIAEYREAIRLKKDYALAHYNLGRVLSDKGWQDEAIAELRTAIRLKPDYADAWGSLGVALYVKGQLEESIAAHREVLRTAAPSDPSLSFAFSNIGLALYDKKQLDAAIAEFREAIRLKKDNAIAHVNLGNALKDKGQLDEAIAEYREAIRHQKDHFEAHFKLGVALQAKGQLDEAIAAYREVIRIDKSHWGAHYNLGNALKDRGQSDEAIAEYRETIRLKEDHAKAHCNLGHALRQQGEFGKALPELRRGHELGSREPKWPYPSAQWVQECEYLADLEVRLPEIIAGKRTPASAAERIDLALVCLYKRLYRASVRFYADAFAIDSKLADDRKASHRYRAAAMAALAGCGQGKDADKLDEKERAGLRRQALDWLRAEREAWDHLLDRPADEARTAASVAQAAQHWLKDTPFAGVRGPEALAKLPEGERQPWQKLWDDVATMAARARGKIPPEKKSPEK
jgi:tetratricopeptide (TPR) repeat protein